MPVAVAAALILAFFLFRPAGNTNTMVSQQPGSSSEEIKHVERVVAGNAVTVTAATVPKSEDRKTEVLKPVRPIAKSVVRPELKRSIVAKIVKAPVVKSEFIALSYAGSAESGQVVRVKVPSSMMVSLGLVSSVNKTTDLVDAEVIVGDDGLTRAIRFIRQ